MICYGDPRRGNFPQKSLISLDLPSHRSEPQAIADGSLIFFSIHPRPNIFAPHGSVLIFPSARRCLGKLAKSIKRRHPMWIFDSYFKGCVTHMGPVARSHPLQPVLSALILHAPQGPPCPR